jgi:hypothetical protein
MKGLLVFIIGDDCTNGGVTSGCKHAVLRVKDCNVFTSQEGCPGLTLIESDNLREYPGYLNIAHGLRPTIRPEDAIIRRVRAVPLTEAGNPVLGGSFGGHYIESCDSRFPYESPIPVFDRFEQENRHER